MGLLSYVRGIINSFGTSLNSVPQVGNKRDRSDDDLSSDEETPVSKRLKQLRKTNFPVTITNSHERSDEYKPSRVRTVPIQIEKRPSTSTPIENHCRERIIPVKLCNFSENGVNTPRKLQMHSPVRPIVTHEIIDDDDDDDDPEITVIESQTQKKVNKAKPKYYINLDEIENVEGQQEEDDVIFLEKVNSPVSHKSYKYFVPSNRNSQLKENHSPSYTLYRKVSERNTSGSPKNINKSKTLGGISKPYKKNVTPIPNWMQPLKINYPSMSKGTKYNYSNLNGNARSALHNIFNLEEKQNYRDLIKRATSTTYKPLIGLKTSDILDRVEDISLFRSTQKAQKNASGNLLLFEKGLAQSKELEASNEYDPITVASISSSDSDIEVIPSGSSTSSMKINRVNTFKDSLSDRAVVANDWLSKLDFKYKKKRQETQLNLADAKRVSDIISKVNCEQNIAQLEHKLKYELSIPESLFEEVPPSAELPKLTPAQEILVNKALGPGPAGQVVVEKFNLRITRRDLHTLAGLNWLNDEVINFYMNLLIQRCEERKDLPKVYATNTFFYPKLMQSGQAGLRRWTRKVDIFAHDLIVVPVHLGVHWCLSIIDFEEKKISYLDSMGGRNQGCLNALKQYLVDEHQDKKGSPYDVSDWTLECLKDIPQQMNGSDCGMFACTFAEFTCRRAPYTFTQAHMPMLRRKMAYEILAGKLLL